MSFNYNPLWKLLIDKNIKPTHLKNELKLSSATLAKMNKNEFISMQVLHKICEHFKVQPNSIIEYIEE